MLRKELIKRSPIRILEKSIHGGLGKGNLGVFTARKGVGKTACLIHVSIDKMFRDSRVLHLSFTDNPHHTEKWYDQIFKEIAEEYRLENVLSNYDIIVKNRLILHFKRKDFEFDHIVETMDRFLTSTSFIPDCLIVDGYPFHNRTTLQLKNWKDLALKRDFEIWFSATLHRHNLALNEQGIPAPINKFCDLFSVIIMLKPRKDYIDLILLKDHDSKNPEKMSLKLEPKTLLIANL